MSIDDVVIRQLQAEIERLQDEVARWRSTANAAADEIEAHWAAHCDASGAGPVSLMRRLRNRPSYYEVPNGYRAVATRIEGFGE